MIQSNESPTPGHGAGLGNSSIPGGIDGSENEPIHGTPQAEIRIPNHVDLRLAELRECLINELFMIFAIGLQAANGLRNAEDVEALADLRRLWMRLSRLTVPATEIKTLVAKQGKAPK